MILEPRVLNRRLKLRDLDTLMTVISAGGMRKAAGQLHLSQPAVSKAVAELEDLLGVSLIDRSRQGVAVTPSGAALIRRSEAIFDELQQAVRDLRHIADPDGGDIRMASTEPIMGGLLSTAMLRMKIHYPKVNFIAESGGTPQRQLQFLLDHESDFVVMRPLGITLDPSVQAEPLVKDRLLVVASRTHPFASRRKLGLADLLDQSWIIGPVELGADSPLVTSFGAAGLPLPRFHVTSGSLNARFALLASGQFITLMPSSYWHFAHGRKDLKVLPVDIGRWHTPTMMLTLRNRSLSPAVLAFQDIVRDLVRPSAD